MSLIFRINCPIKEECGQKNIIQIPTLPKNNTISLPFYYKESKEKFNHVIFKNTVLEFYLKNPCPLCGKIHTPKFYIFVDRSYKTKDKTIIIKVFRLICKNNKNEREKNKKFKKPYTITILPSFLIPYSRILLDSIIDTVDMYLTVPNITLEKSTNLMNLENIKSFTRYFKRIKRQLNKWINSLAQNIRNFDQSISLPKVTDTKNYTNPILNNWLKLKHLTTIYLKYHQSIPGIIYIPDYKKVQFIYCEFHSANMGLGP